MVPSTAKRAEQRWGALELVHNGSGPHQENTIRCYSEFLEFFNRQAAFRTKAGLSVPLKIYTTTQQGAQKFHSLGNIPIPSADSYRKRLVEKVKSVIRRMRWKAFFFTLPPPSSTSSLFTLSFCAPCCVVVYSQLR